VKAASPDPVKGRQWRHTGHKDHSFCQPLMFGPD